MSVINDIRIIDTDTHVVEPPDLWTSRLSSKWGELVPHVRWDDAVGEEAWFTGNQRLGAGGGPAIAGGDQHPPFHTPRWAQTHPTAPGPRQRLALLDGQGITGPTLDP